jgi:two-component system chemotaxis response regulator CheB
VLAQGSLRQWCTPNLAPAFRTVLAGEVANRDLIVIGASAGGVEALRAVVAKLPPDLPAAVLVVLHLPDSSRSALPSILHRAGPLPAAHPRDGMPLAPGQIVVAPPNHHLTVLDGAVRLTHGPRENGHRPAIDPLFRSAARWYGPRVIGVVLSGTLDDGTAGQMAIAAAGGATVVQDPDDALYPGMPRSVLEHLSVDHIAPATELGLMLGMLAGQPLPENRRAKPSPSLRAETAMSESPPLAGTEPVGDPAGLGCPQCGGSLYEFEEGPLVRYRCRVGHAWSPQSLLAEQSEALESALWMALRTLEDRAALCRRAEKSAAERGHHHVVERFRTQAIDAEGAARVLRAALERAQHATRDAATAIGEEMG